MRDFKRIGGEILSSPLNENFRRLRDDISIANSNLVFSDKYGIMATVQDMYDLLTNPEVEVVEGQACYVVSSGELYRYSNLDEKWHKIADFGQTFRQAFLNSGVVLVEKPIEVSTDYLIMPRMLVYFKNKPGEDPYLKGMYLIPEYSDLEVVPSHYPEKNIMYSIYVDYSKTYHVEPGLPKSDDPNNIFVGAFMFHTEDGSTYELTNELIYTVPDIAYTADRGNFLVNGGQISGGELYANTDNHTLGRKFGLYYDEGVNYPGASYYTYQFNSLPIGSYTIKIDDNVIGYFTTTEAIDILGELDYFPEHADRISVRLNDLIIATYNVNLGSSVGEILDFNVQNSIDNYPKTLDDTSNYNVAEISSLGSATGLYYTTPKQSIQSLQIDIIDTSTTPATHHPIDTIIYNKYYNPINNALENVPEECYTIQKHFVTPTGQNIMVYGDAVYESYDDAESHLNTGVELDAEFLAAETTRVIVYNPASGDAFNPETDCAFFTVNRLTQVGTISPVFADNEFKIYSHDDVSPTFLSIDLDKVRNEIVNNYKIQPHSYAYTQYNFALDGKYIKGSAGHTDVESVTPSQTAYHDIDTNNKGYVIPSLTQLENLRQRVNGIETQLWEDYHEYQPDSITASERYDQSARYRLYKLENDIYNDYDDPDNSEKILRRLQVAEDKIAWAEAHKADKETIINGHVLGDPNEVYPEVPYTITLITNDIDEPQNAGVNDNRWFTEQRVRNTDWVTEAHTHVGRKGTGTESNANPHAMSTDDISVLNNSDHQFVTLNEKDKLAHVPGGPNYTDVQLQNLATTKIENIPVYTIDDDTQAENFVVNMKTLKVHSHGANVTYNGTTAILECVGQIDENTVLMRSDYTPIADSTVGKDGYVDKALVADYAESINTTGVTASQYYGTDANYESTDPEVEPTSVGWHDLPVYVSTESAEGAANIDSILLRPEENSVALKHLATSRVVYTAADEETDLNDNVYNLVKNHYHKVYNSGTQGPYIEDPSNPGSYIQDTSAIIYTYKVPYGGMAEHVYYFEYNNTNYTFSTVNLGNLPVNTILTYYPTSGNIEVEVSSVTHTLTTSQVLPTVVDDDFFVEFVAQTDWSKINKWNFGNNLSVTVADGIATINAFNATSDVPVHAFINLDDVDFVYNNAQPGQMLVINADGNGIDVSNAPTLSSYMLISDYVNSAQPTKVNAAVAADTASSATTAGSAALLQGTYSVNNNNTDASSLWTSSKISTFVSARIAAEGVRTDYGTDLPNVHTFSFTPKRGDLYILTES